LQRELASLRAALEDYRAQLQELQATVRRLQEQLAAARKDSSTSSKPPSSDIVKPPRTTAAPDKSPLAPGGQVGHPKHERPPFRPEEIQASYEYRVSVCPDCGQALHPTGFGPRVVQQVELQPVPLRVEEHRQHESYCPCCDKVHYGLLPPAVQRGGLLGPRLTALVAYQPVEKVIRKLKLRQKNPENCTVELQQTVPFSTGCYLKGVCHASYSTVRKFLRDIVGLTVSRGQLAKVVAKASAALAWPYQQLLEDLPAQARLNVDETSHKDNGELLWAWCFRAELYTLFKIDPTRSAEVLIGVLGEEFDGVLGCDCFSAYRRYMRECDARLQLCLAHLIREVKYLTTLPDAPTRGYGERLREALRGLFGVIHQRERLPAALFQSRLRAARALVMRRATEGVPPTRAAANLAKRMEQYGESYFRFITTPGVEPTNNLAEQAIRFAVIDRRITQGTRGEAGQRWCERIWSVIATCAQQGRSVWEYLEAAVQAHFNDEGAPALLPGGS
jgi:transposase